MVHFREHRWLLVNGQSRFSAFISTDDRTREDVLWSLDLHYVAGGAVWRRVRSWERPSLWVGLTGYHPGTRHWTDLERACFWELDRDEEEESLWGRGGGLDVHYDPRQAPQDLQHSFINDHIWRVAARDGAWFTVELAAFADGRNILKELAGQEVLVTAEGKEERREPDAEFWKKHAELYLLENVPFGTVTVRVPRNVREPEAYALRRARELVGVDEPEHIEVNDFYKRDPDCQENIREDVFVELQFNGYFED
jgi:hypothetical protein